MPRFSDVRVGDRFKFTANPYTYQKLSENWICRMVSPNEKIRVDSYIEFSEVRVVDDGRRKIVDLDDGEAFYFSQTDLKQRKFACRKYKTHVTDSFNINATLDERLCNTWVWPERPERRFMFMDFVKGL